MIQKLEVKNFKSIKELTLDCKRINVFIGQPNSGKSNILETLGVLSYAGYSNINPFNNFVRFERVSNLFRDEDLEQTITINTDDMTFTLAFKDSSFKGKAYQGERTIFELSGDYSDIHMGMSDITNSDVPRFKSYRFSVRKDFPRPESGFLLPVAGANLMSLILTHKDLRSLVNDIFSPFGFRLGLRPQENKIEVVKDIEDIIVSYPYSLTSDTLQRVVFYMCAILSNKDSILIFEEPESHAFPYYTKYLAESMAMDENNNQYFLSTHNPYLLQPLLAKTPKEDIGVFITYFQDYQTKVKPLSQDEMAEILEIDVFSNLERYLETA